MTSKFPKPQVVATNEMVYGLKVELEKFIRNNKQDLELVWLNYTNKFHHLRVQMKELLDFVGIRSDTKVYHHMQWTNVGVEPWSLEFAIFNRLRGNAGW